MNNISRLHYITQDNVFGYTHAQLAEEVCMGGAEWVQLRVKKKGYSEWKEIAEDVQRVCKKYKAKLIINDNVRIAKEISAAGVHLGKSDLDVAEARKILGEGFIIGGTANDFMDIEKLSDARVDYIGLGPFRFTKTKENLSPILGLEGFTSIMQACKESKIEIPVIAIGGILPSDIAKLLKTGVFGIAVSSGINMAEDIEDMYKQYHKAISKNVSKTKTSKSS
jgi:thiamine-phosphate pyrophosphorylase